MLYLVGIGLGIGDISARGMDTIGKSSRLFLDQYTNFIPDEELKSMNSAFGKEPELLERSDLEENAAKTIEKAKSENIVILVPGDPLIATTHHTILDTAKKLGIKYEIIHCVSIFSAAIGESGLDIYRFGPTTTIPFWTDKYKPVSFIDVIAQNFNNNQHTLILLDYDYKNRKRMTLVEAIQFLHKADESTGRNLIKKETKILILGNVGKVNQSIHYVAIDEMNKEVLKEFLDKTLSLIFPAKLNFAEVEALSKFV